MITQLFIPVKNMKCINIMLHFRPRIPSLPAWIYEVYKLLWPSETNRRKRGKVTAINYNLRG